MDGRRDKITVGDAGRVQRGSSRTGQLLADLAELRRLITLHADQLVDAAAARLAADVLGEQATSVEPDAGLLRAELSGLSVSVGPVAAVAAALDRVRHAFGF